VRVFDIGKKDGPEIVSDRVLTVPNLLSLARIAALPIIYLDLVAGRLIRALVLLGVFAATDWLDGYLARRFDQVSKLGKVLDPTSDRILFVVVAHGWVEAPVPLAQVVHGATEAERPVAPGPDRDAEHVYAGLGDRLPVLGEGAAAVGPGVEPFDLPEQVRGGGGGALRRRGPGAHQGLLPQPWELRSLGPGQTPGSHRLAEMPP
jgi:hypothetical protein